MVKKDTLKIKNWIIASIIFLILFILTALSLKTTLVNNLDLKINSLMPQIQTPLLITISKIIGTIIDPEPMIIGGLILAIIIWFFYSKKEAIFLANSMIFSGILILAIKNIIRIPRPTNSLVENSFLSFPSGHTAISIVLFGIFSYWIIKKYKSELTKIITLSITSIIILIVSFSRIYLNAHWFSDVLAGLFLGSFILSLVISSRTIINKIINKFFN